MRVALAAAALLAGVVALGPRALADFDVLRAKRLLREGEFDGAREACDRALRRVPAHRRATALRKEVLDAWMARLKAVPFACGSPMLEIDDLYSSATRAFNLFEFSEAQDRLRRMIERSASLPDGIELRHRLEQAVEMLRRIGGILEDHLLTK